MSEKLSFKIDGEWLTEFARNMFWDANKGYDYCENLLMCGLNNDEITDEQKKLIVVEILEGRKKLVGVNTYILEDDNSTIRPLSLKIQDLEKENAISKIREHIQNHAIDYVDPYSANKSYKQMVEDIVYYNHSIKTIEEIKTYFWYSNDNIDFTNMCPIDINSTLVKSDDITNAGLWLLNSPYLIYKITKGNLDMLQTPEFWKAIYEELKDSDNPYMIHRNNKYLASMRIQEEKFRRFERNEKRFNGYFEERHEMTEIRQSNLNYAKDLLKIFQDVRDENHLNVKTNIFDKYDFACYELEIAIDILSNLDERDDFSYHLLPDNMINWGGLISPNGNFYSCEFGGHNIRAYHLLVCRPDLFLDVDIYEKEGDDLKIRADNALDVLINKGWVATRYQPNIGEYITTPLDQGGFKQITKDQWDKIYDVMMMHDVKIDLSKIEKSY